MRIIINFFDFLINFNKKILEKFTVIWYHTISKCATRVVKLKSDLWRQTNEDS